MTTSELARELGIAASTVRQHARLGNLPFETTPGGHRRYDLGAVRALLETNRVPAPLADERSPPVPDPSAFESDDALPPDADDPEDIDELIEELLEAEPARRPRRPRGPRAGDDG